MTGESTVRVFQVESIHCAGCVATIRDELGGMDGMQEVRPEQETDRVRVRYDPDKVNGDAILARLEEAGFPVVAQVEPEVGAGLGRYALLVLAVLLVALAGYVGSVLYPRFDLPAVEGAGVLALASAAGVASFFSPCSFPLLLALLGRHTAPDADKPQEHTARPIVFGGALALGAGTFLLIAGVVIAVAGEALFAGVVFDSPTGIALRSIVGVLLVFLGLVQVGVLPISMHAVSKAVRPLTRRQAKLRRNRPVAGHALFGFGYVLAGFG
jgi:copper chaperone CopZ